MVLFTVIPRIIQTGGMEPSVNVWLDFQACRQDICWAMAANILQWPQVMMTRNRTFYQNISFCSLKSSGSFQKTVNSWLWDGKESNHLFSTEFPCQVVHGWIFLTEDSIPSRKNFCLNPYRPAFHLERTTKGAMTEWSDNMSKLGRSFEKALWFYTQVAEFY